MRFACIALALACTSIAQAASTMDPAAFDAQKLRIDQLYRQAQGRCELLEGHARDVCDQRARGEHSVRLADLQMRAQPTPDNARRLRLARAEAAYASRIMNCTAMLGAARTVCRQDAEAALAEATGRPGTQPQRPGRTFDERSAQPERIAQAQLKAARERCEMQPQAAQPACMADAQRRFDALAAVSRGNG